MTARGSERGRLVLVTGAGSGIGRSTAIAFAGAGARVIAVDLDPKRVTDVAAHLGAACAMSGSVDVGNRNAMRQLANDVHSRFGALDILVNNAGVGHDGGILGTPLEHWDAVVRVNLFGAIHGCHFFVPPMVEGKRGGHVVNVASILGLRAMGGVAPYSTTKFALVGFSESIRQELEPHKIGVTAICPGLIATDIANRGYFVNESSRSSSVDLFRSGHSPDLVASAILTAVDGNGGIVPVGVDGWVATL